MSGNSFDVSKSGLQKSIRSGDVEQAVFFALDLFTCALLTCNTSAIAREYFTRNPQFRTNGSKTMKALVTNTLNRLRVCACEDVGMAAHPLLFPRIDVELCAIEEWRKGGAGLSGFTAAAHRVGAIAALLAASPKSRSFSHFRAVLHLPMYTGTGTKDSTWQPYMRAHAAALSRLFGVEDTVLGARIPLFATLKAFQQHLIRIGFNPATADEGRTLEVMKVFVETKCGAAPAMKTLLLRWFKDKQDATILYQAMGYCYRLGKEACTLF